VQGGHLRDEGGRKEIREWRLEIGRGGKMPTGQRTTAENTSSKHLTDSCHPSVMCGPFKTLAGARSVPFFIHVLY